MSAVTLEAPATDAHLERPSRTKLFFLLSLMVSIWALNFIVAKSVARQMPLITMAALRTVIAGVCVIPVYLLKGEGRWTRADLPLMLVLGLCGVALNQAFFVVGLAMTSVAHAAIVSALGPVQVLLIAAMRGQERLTAGKLGGLAVAFTGVGVLQLAKSGHSGASLRGDLFVYASTLLFACFSVFGKAPSRRIGAFTMTSIAYMGSGLAMIPVVAITGKDLNWSALPWGVWAGLLYMAAFSSVIAYLIYNYALTWVQASRVAAFCYAQPILAALLGWLILGEALTALVVVSAALVLAGVMLVERAR